MNQKIKSILIVLLLLICNLLFGQKYVADYSVAKESVLRKIPVEYINKARTQLKIAYQHTSHGTHVSMGIFGLPGYKTGDDVLFAVTNNSPTTGKLEFHDYAMQNFAPSGVNGSDLSANETAFLQTTRNYLDAPANAGINVVMWSWCDITNHNIKTNYLPGMNQLIAEYGSGGTKIGTGSGKRQTPVTFVYMTGHAVDNANVGTGKPRNQADTIKRECNLKQRYCLDYYTIDTYDMNDKYWEDASDDGYSKANNGNFLKSWQDTHQLGTDYYASRTAPYPGGQVQAGAHNTQYITANRKAYAMWWILARIAGWDGNSTSTGTKTLESDTNEIRVFPNPTNGELKFSETLTNFKVYSIYGQLVFPETKSANAISAKELSDGMYLIRTKNLTLKFLVKH